VPPATKSRRRSRLRRAAAEREQKNLKLLKTKSQASEEALREQQRRLAEIEKSLTELERSVGGKRIAPGNSASAQ
jgi:hypothetical protein